MIHGTFIKFVEKNARKSPNDEFVFFPDDNLRITKCKVYQESISVAKGLLSRGIKKGDRVAILSENSYELILLFLACTYIGAVAVLLNSRLNVGEMSYILKDCKPIALAFSEGSKGIVYSEIINEVIEKNKNLRREDFVNNLIYMNQNHRCNCSYISFNDLKSNGADISNANFADACKCVDENDGVLLMYTSGTTGNSKGVLISQFSLINNAKIVAKGKIGVKKTDKICSALPLYHIFSLTLVLCASIVLDTKFTILKYFSTRKQMDIMEKEKSTVLYAVPSMLIAFLSINNLKNCASVKLRKIVSGGAHCHIKTIRDSIKRFDAESFYYGYGLTETTAAIAVNEINVNSSNDDFYTVGTAIDGVEIKIVDHETGRDLNNGEQGDIFCRGFCVAGQYYGNSGDNGIFTDDGWFNTGDIGKIDEKSRLYITGRRKDIINKGSECILAKEIEETIMQEAGISDVQVIGVEDKFFGEEIAAYVIRNDFSIDADKIKSIVKEKLSARKVPKYVIFKNEFPMTSTGKVKKYMLK